MEMTGQRPRFLPGEWAWVSGASSGIGRAVALRFAREGVGVFLSARTATALEDLVREIAATGGQAVALPLDVAQPAAIQDAAAQIQERAARLDIVALCAGVELMLPFQMVSPEKWQRLWSVNVLGAFEMVRAALPQLKASGRREDGQGRIVFVSSVAGVRGWPGQTAYSASKAAVLGGMRSLAAELAPMRVRANAVACSFVETDMQKRLFARMPEASRAAMVAQHPFGLGKPDDVASAIAFLASNEAQWITGQTLVLDGGLSVA